MRTISVLAALLFLPVLPLQLLGYTGTCTQNDIDPFLAGAAFSAPFASASLILGLLSVRKMRARRCRRGHATAGLSHLALAGLAVRAILMNFNVAYDTLFRGVSPCGADYSTYGRGFEPEYLLIGCIYGLLPSIVFTVAAFGAWAGLPKAPARHTKSD